jgi:carboxyl-terminal processing protease
MLYIQVPVQIKEGFMNILRQGVHLRWVGAIVITLQLAACGGGGSSAGNTPEACFAGNGRGEVLNIMRQWYLWNDEADQFNKYRNLDLRSFGDADALLDFLRYQPGQFDRGFSYITTPEEEAAFFGEGEFVGFGFGMIRIGSEIRFSLVYPGSPAGGAGFQRGYRLLAINGRSIAQIEAAEGLGAALGPPQVGFSRTFTVADTAGQTLPPVNLSKAVVMINPVPVVEVFDNTGYILFNTFITSAANQLRAAFAELGMANVNNVVVDLRYNGGGLVDVSEVLASLLRGPGHESDIYSETIFNSARDAEISAAYKRTFFHTEANALTLAKIVFITSEGSASASELVINGLAPYFRGQGQFALVGSATYGKPVGQFGFDFCNEDYRLRAVTFKSVNVDGEGDYFNGLPVDCAAADDVFHPLGNADETSLAAALNYLETGSCPVASAPGPGISSASGAAAKTRPIMGGGLAGQYAGAF